MRGRIAAIPLHWQNWLLSIFFLLLFPLVPLLFEWLFTGGVSSSSLQLIASTYAITVSVSSRDMLLFGIGMLIEFIFAVFYGYSVSVSAGIHGANGAAIAAIVFVCLFHSFERYNRHVVERAPFLEFMQMRDGE